MEGDCSELICGALTTFQGYGIEQKIDIRLKNPRLYRVLAILSATGLRLIWFIKIDMVSICENSSNYRTEVNAFWYSILEFFQGQGIVAYCYGLVLLLKCQEIYRSHPCLAN